MTGQLGGLYEILSLFASFLISSIAQKFFTISILKNLYVIDWNKSQNKDDKNNKNTNISSIRDRLNINQPELVEEVKVDSIEDNNSSMVEGSQVRIVHDSLRWFRYEHDNNNSKLKLTQSDAESYQNKISERLSSITRYAPRLKDYIFANSKVVRWVTLWK